jgi:hypothetical protein
VPAVEDLTFSGPKTRIEFWAYPADAAIGKQAAMTIAREKAELIMVTPPLTVVRCLQARNNSGSGKLAQHCENQQLSEKPSREEDANGIFRARLEMSELSI